MSSTVPTTPAIAPAATSERGRLLQREANVDEVVRRPRPGVAERQAPFIATCDLVHAPVETLGVRALDEEGRIQDHPLADRLVQLRRHGIRAKRVVDLAHI